MNMVTRTDLRKAYDEKGYVIVRNAIDPGLAAEMVDHIHWLGHKHPGVRPEHFHHNFEALLCPGWTMRMRNDRGLFRVNICHLRGVRHGMLCDEIESVDFNYEGEI